MWNGVAHIRLYKPRTLIPDGIQHTRDTVVRWIREKTTNMEHMFGPARDTAPPVYDLSILCVSSQRFAVCFAYLSRLYVLQLLGGCRAYPPVVADPQ